MKKLKINYLIMGALLLGSGLALATQSAARQKTALATRWERVAQDGDDAGTWRPVTSESCEASDKMCKADFATGYDPSQHTEAQNNSAALSGTIQTGYVQQ
jgi:hypothetical protein